MEAGLRMDTILDTNAAVESVRQAYEKRIDYDGTTDQPKPEWVRGACPQCGSPVVSNCYYIGGKGYIVCFECWQSLGENPTCNYRKIL